MNYTSFIYGCSFAILLSACGGDGNRFTHPGSFSSATSSLSYSSSSHSIVIPASLNDKMVRQTIERITSTLPSGTHRETGDLHVYYGGNGALVGDSLLLNTSAVAATYTAVFTAAQREIQVTSYQISPYQTAPQLPEPARVKTVDSYRFTSATEGIWVQNYNDSSLLVEGRFTIQDKDYPGFAPLSFAGRKASLTFAKTVTNLPPGTYISSGTAFHIYQSSTHFTTDLSSYGLPAGEGNYIYDRPALNIGRDTGFNITFNAPYQIEYTFNSLSSGTFKENWNNGEILWEGTFVTDSIE